MDDRTDDIMRKSLDKIKTEAKHWFDVNKDGRVNKDDVKKLMMRYEWIIITGLLLTIFPMLNVLGYTNIDSDFFWALAGLCLTVEGIIELYYEQKHWDKLKERK